MENKFERLTQLRKQKEAIDAEIAQLVTELTSIIKPRKRKSKSAKAEKLPPMKL